MQLAGNPWPIGAITHLLTEAQGNYKLAEYTHYTGALDCVMLMELGQATAVCGFISQLPPFPNLCHVPLITQDSSLDREIVSVKTLSSSTKPQALGFSLPPHCCNPLDGLHSPRFLLTASSRDQPGGQQLLSRVIYSTSGVHSWRKQLAKSTSLMLRKWKETVRETN